jgi:hypothetical protein
MVKVTGCYAILQNINLFNLFIGAITSHMRNPITRSIKHITPLASNTVHRVSTEVFFLFMVEDEFLMKYMEFRKFHGIPRHFYCKISPEFRENFRILNSVCTVLYGLAKFPPLFC